MNLKHCTFAAAAAALMGLGSVAQAQTTLPEDANTHGSTIIIVTPPEAGAPGSAAVFAPVDDADRPLTRDEVKSEARSAVSEGSIPRGERGQADQTQHLQPSVEDEQQRAARP